MATKALGGVGLADGMTVFTQFGAQAVGVVATAAWSAVATVGIVLVVRAMIGLRVDPDDETQGLDFTQHGETGYNL